MRGGRIDSDVSFIAVVIASILLGMFMGYQIGYNKNIGRQTVIEYQLDRAEERL